METRGVSLPRQTNGLGPMSLEIGLFVGTKRVSLSVQKAGNDRVPDQHFVAKKAQEKRQCAGKRDSGKRSKAAHTKHNQK